MTPTPPAPLPTQPRIAAIDAYRGFVMFLMLAEVLHLAAVAKAVPATNPDKSFWVFVAHHQTHVEWGGCTLHDLIQPSFSFLVGAALPFSLASRSARGQSFGRRAFHALFRSVLLVWLGVFLRSVGQPQTNWIFTDTLSQIGLGYFFLFLLGHTRERVQWLAFGVILVGYWAFFAASTPETLPIEQTGVKAEWNQHPTGFGLHWDKNTNPAAAFDRWFLNLFPQAKPFVYNSGGYATLNFIPTLATMILGLIAGGRLRYPSDTKTKFWNLLGLGMGFLLAGYVADVTGLCPSVKRIWTPAWVLFSGGWCFLILAAFYAATDWSEWSTWTFPLRVIGANSILAYCMAHLIDKFILGTFKTHLGQDVFKQFGTAYEPFVGGVAVLAVYWLILLWLYQKKLFVRI
jgi:predicted acyltransferase